MRIVRLLISIRIGVRTSQGHDPEDGEFIPATLGMERIVAAALAFVLLCSSTAVAEQQTEGWWPAKGMVSLIRLIANGAPYEGKEITTTGILVYRFEEHMLYVGTSDADLHNASNGVWLELNSTLEQDALLQNNRLVMVTGTYDLPDKGSYGICPNGALVKVTRIEVWNQPPHWLGAPGKEPRSSK